MQPPRYREWKGDDGVTNFVHIVDGTKQRHRAASPWALFFMPLYVGAALLLTALFAGR